MRGGVKVPSGSRSSTNDPFMLLSRTVEREALGHCQGELLHAVAY